LKWSGGENPGVKDSNAVKEKRFNVPKNEKDCPNAFTENEFSRDPKKGGGERPPFPLKRQGGREKGGN